MDKTNLEKKFWELVNGCSSWSVTATEFPEMKKLTIRLKSGRTTWLLYVPGNITLDTLEMLDMLLVANKD